MTSERQRRTGWWLLCAVSCVWARSSSVKVNGFLFWSVFSLRLPLVIPRIVAFFSFYLFRISQFHACSDIWHNHQSDWMTDFIALNYVSFVFRQVVDSGRVSDSGRPYQNEWMNGMELTELSIYNFKTSFYFTHLMTIDQIRNWMATASQARENTRVCSAVCASLYGPFVSSALRESLQ